MVEGPVLVLAKVNREHIGEYVCLADNGVTPPAQKALSLEVHCTVIHNPYGMIYFLDVLF